MAGQGPGWGGAQSHNKDFVHLNEEYVGSHCKATKLLREVTFSLCHSWHSVFHHKMVFTSCPWGSEVGLLGYPCAPTGIRNAKLSPTSGIK